MATIDQIKREEQHDRIARKMISEHKKSSKKDKLRPYSVPGDPCHTVFYCKSKERGEKKVNGYKQEHKSFWL